MRLSEIANDKTIEHIFKVIRDDILTGESKIRSAVADNKIRMKDIVYSIRNERCLGLKDVDIGSTYLEQLVSRTINDNPGIPPDYINFARRLFGLSKLDRDELISVVKKRQQKKSNQK